MERPLKPLHWVSSSLDDLRGLPEGVQDSFGYALHRAQEGTKHESAKPLHGFGGASVLEIVENFDGNTFRAVYTVKFAAAVYVLHAFQKKAKKGIATPTADMSLIHLRLRNAAEHYAQNYRRNRV